ncbi:DUF4376 domain-containing protein [Halomonas sp. HG01]|uniref:DUF4376 domain-containing protein n=1 Tax=Halomonas sp. HG01 TaxID=1609967 RepID=UPI000AFDA216|nr:DUF4376 domain-containing protein [Halomonas sp. HG01]
MFYSPSQNSFYPSSLRSSYELSGMWPDDAVPVSKAAFEKYKGAPPAGMTRGADDGGYPAWVEIPPLSLEDLATRQRAAIAAALADALAAGMPYTMPDGTEDTVQMLAEDRQNLLGLAIEARDLKAAGVSDPVQEFRGLSNTRYPMTPDQVIALTDAALGHYKDLLQQSWDRKDAIDAALAAEDREGIEAVVW